MSRSLFSRAAGMTVFALATALAAASAAAQPAWPSRPVKIVVPSTSGGPLDTVARAMSARLGELLGQPIVIENKPGAGTNIGAEYVARSAPDGYTVLATTLSITLNPSLYGNVPYDPLRDFVPITQAASVTNLLVVHPDVPARNVNELIDYMRRNPGKVSAGTGGVGVAGHMAAELFKRAAKVDMTVVPYKGSGPAVNDLLGGQVMVAFEAAIVELPHVQAGKLRPLAVTGPKRTSLLPDLPTIAEAALPGYETTNWYGFLAPAGTPRPVIDRLHRDIVRTLNDPAVKAKLASLGAEVIGNTPQEFGENMKSEFEKWRAVVRESGIRAE